MLSFFYPLGKELAVISPDLSHQMAQFSILRGVEGPTHQTAAKVAKPQGGVSQAHLRTQDNKH